MSYVNTSHLGTDAHEWLNALDFYEKDLSILDKRLLEVAGKNNGKEAAEGLEHFQNQFSIQQQNLRDLKHRIKDNNRVAAGDVQHHANHVGMDVINHKEKIGDDMKRFESTMKELRQEFNVFLTKWM